MSSNDTIVALSSGALPSGVAVIRLSGPQVGPILTTIAGGTPEARRLTLRPIGGETLLDRGLVAWFPAPHSFTGEDCAELQVHGSPAGVKAILRLIQTHGARLAEPGEFTRRAFENGKLDLVEIEGLGDLLDAQTENQRRQALGRLEGGISRQIDGWRDQLLDLRAEIEAQLDFSDEGDVGELPATFAQAIADLQQQFATSLASIEHGRIIREGIRVALGGAPNAGKSSLLNALARADIAIVTDEAGTTRDVREVPLDINGQLYILLDLAGIRQTSSKAEAEGVRRAQVALASADIVVWLTAPDIDDGHLPEREQAHLVVGTKADVARVPDAGLHVSSATGEGLDDLFAAIETLGNQLVGGEPGLLSRERDRMALMSARDALDGAAGQLDRPELAAESLRTASHALERLVGRLDAERVLDRLFASFCIGK